MEELHDKVRSAANEQNASLKGDDYDPDNVRSHFREMFQSAVKLREYTATFAFNRLQLTLKIDNDPKDPSQPAFFLATARLMCEINHLDSELEELKEHMESVNEEVTDMFNDFLVRYNLSCEDLVEEASPAVEPGEATVRAFVARPFGFRTDAVAVEYRASHSPRGKGL